MTIQTWKRRAKLLQTEVYALYLAYRDPRTPWYARLWAALVVGYAFSPLDLIPDPIPVLGALDDLILLPLGVALALRLIPAPVMAEARIRAREVQDGPTNWLVVGCIAALWIGLAAAVIVWVVK